MGRGIVHFPDLPIKLLMPSSFSNIKEIALKTVPSASKAEIKRVVESFYSFEVEKVRTLNMRGKMKNRGGRLIAKPDYKKAYVTLKNPLSITDIYPFSLFGEEKKESTSGTIEEGDMKSQFA